MTFNWLFALSKYLKKQPKYLYKKTQNKTNTLMAPSLHVSLTENRKWKTLEKQPAPYMLLFKQLQQPCVAMLFVIMLWTYLDLKVHFLFTFTTHFLHILWILPCMHCQMKTNYVLAATWRVSFLLFTATASMYSVCVSTFEQICFLTFLWQCAVVLAYLSWSFY